MVRAGRILPATLKKPMGVPDGIDDDEVQALVCYWEESIGDANV